jgi:O-antigen/teichoic acid export membrane protein
MSATKKNIIWSLMGNGLPLIAGVILFPKVIDSYGLNQFGLLTLAWALIGYFSLFDLGLSRALTHQISQATSENRSAREIAELTETTLIIIWVLGIFGGLILWFITPWIVISLLKIPSDSIHGSIEAFSLLAFVIPIVVHTSGLRAILEALHQFKSASLIRTFMGVGTFLGPYISSFISTSLTSPIVALILLRLLTWGMHIFAVHKTQILSAPHTLFNAGWLKPLFQFGGWMTVSNIIGPFLYYLDRFFIASILGASAAALYVAPYELITKMLIVPAAISGVLFPIFAKQWVNDPDISAKRLNQGIFYSAILLIPPSILLCFFAPEWLELWLGSKFSETGPAVVTWLSIGILFNSAAQIIFSKVQGAGRSDWTAKLHIAELLPYFALLWISLNIWGIAGAAFTWTARVFIDLLGLIYFGRKINPLNLSIIKPGLAFVSIFAFFLLISLLNLSLNTRLGISFFGLLAYAACSLAYLKTDGRLHWLKIK